MHERQLKTLMSCSISSDQPRNLAKSRITTWDNLARRAGSCQSLWWAQRRGRGVCAEPFVGYEGRGIFMTRCQGFITL